MHERKTPAGLFNFYFTKENLEKIEFCKKAGFHQDQNPVSVYGLDKSIPSRYFLARFSVLESFLVV